MLAFYERHTRRLAESLTTWSVAELRGQIHSSMVCPTPAKKAIHSSLVINTGGAKGSWWPKMSKKCSQPRGTKGGSHREPKTVLLHNLAPRTEASAWLSKVGGGLTTLYPQDSFQGEPTAQNCYSGGALRRGGLKGWLSIARGGLAMPKLKAVAKQAQESLTI